ncbi:extracellular solute-binding protein [Lactococcus petauri]|uniref:extracellular solute-binding protein n=1 Tax=Lactococcus petauri TaxID=1940789 RepID=UPI002550C8B7|nr:extracellular solute-binding protein [Lactococcus petauri]
MAEENFFESNLATTKFDGKTYAVPWVNDVRALYYRTDTLESVGIKKAPETWEEFMTAAKKLTERGEGNYGLSIDANEQSFGFMMGRQAGSELIKDGKALFNQPEFIQGVSYINDFIQKGYAPAQPIATDITQTFGGEEPKTPMFISGPWMVSLLNEAGNNIKGNYATAVLPKGPANNDSVVGGNNLAIANWSNQKDESAEFLEYMSNSETQLEWYKLVNGLPTSKKALEDEAISGDELMKPFVEQLEHAQPMPMVPQYEQIAQSFLAFQQELWVNNADVKEKMNDFQAKAEELLK